MDFIDKIYEIAKKNKKRVAVPECTNDRMMKLAVKAHQEGLAEVVFVGDLEEIKKVAAENNVDLSDIEIVNTKDETVREDLLSRYDALPRKKIMGKAYVKMFMEKPLFTSLVMEAVGDVDCTYGGLDTTTSEFVMAASGILGLAEGCSNPSAITLMEVLNQEGEVIKLMGMSDGAINTEPNAEQLASIAIAACDSFMALTGETARAAILSYSTDGSGNSSSVFTEREARDLAQSRRPDLLIDGEFQIDTALLPRVAERKMKRPSEVAGKANVLIFPDAAACNIGSKLLGMYAPSRAYGPVYQGFAKTVLDCSRGATDQVLYNNFAFCSAMVACQEK